MTPRTYSTDTTNTPQSRALHDARNLDTLARRRAGAKLGWFVHAGIYLAVNLGLAAISLSQGRSWAVYPALGWGLGLAIHGMVVWLLMPGSGLMNRMVERERERLEAETRT